MLWLEDEQALGRREGRVIDYPILYQKKDLDVNWNWWFG